MSKDVFLRTEGIEKIFSGIHVLKDVNFDVKVGEVHALCGQNGAGKSTLIKILTGVYPKDGGEIYIKGKPVEINSRKDSLAAGIGVVYQELSMMPNLTVAQNIMIGREKMTCGFLKKKEMSLEVQKLIDSYGLDIDADEMVSELSTAESQMVEILRAVSGNAEMIILDEPTASLSYKESEILFSMIRSLKERNISVIYISHRMDEIFQMADRITVLRDGLVVNVFNKEEIDPMQVVQSMIGKRLNLQRERELNQGAGRPLLELKHVTKTGSFQDISLNLYPGEILCIGGLVGSGRTELLRCIFGDDKCTSGEILLEGKKLGTNIRKNIKDGLGYITEDRLSEGYIPLLSIEKNVSITNFEKTSKTSLMILREEKKLGQKVVEDLNVSPRDSQKQVQKLSGGNQQKVVVGKWLERNPKVLLVDEPTVGVDVGAKDEIYRILEQMAEKGAGILMVSSDNAEIVRVATRVLVMRRGRIVAEQSEGMPSELWISANAMGVDTIEEGA